MSLFFNLLSAINNPNQNGSVAQLSSVAQGLNQLSKQHNVSPDSMSSMLSALGPELGSTLQSQGSNSTRIFEMMGKMATGSGGGSALQSVLTPQVQRHLAQSVSKKSGLNAKTITAMLPGLLPLVMQLLNMGTSRSGLPGSNPLLSAFMSGGGAGSADLGHAMKFASRFLQSA